MQKLKQFVPFLVAIYFIHFLWLACSPPEQAAGNRDNLPEENQIRVMFYNVENLFDTIQDSTINDTEFLPSGYKAWNGYKYWQKLKNTYKVINNVGEWDMPALVGLCEVENEAVLQDLINWTPLNTFDYGIVHENSPDWRGIDVALLYREDIYTPVHEEYIIIKMPFAPDTRTRDILYSAGKIGEDTLHIFVNHWPSRYGGKEASDPKRVFVAEQLRKKVDSVLKINASAKIIIMGDFNDDPKDQSLSMALKAADDTINMDYGNLYNPMYKMNMQGRGTSKYRSSWNTLDQIIISEGLITAKNKLTTDIGDTHIYETDWLLEEDKKYPGVKPFRTYAGPNYLGGFSDHLPVYIDLKYRISR